MVAGATTTDGRTYAAAGVVVGPCCQLANPGAGCNLSIDPKVSNPIDLASITLESGCTADGAPIPPSDSNQRRGLGMPMAGVMKWQQASDGLF
jgi:hypothetical protein